MANPDFAKMHDDVLTGAGQIALFLFGDTKQRRRIYNLVENDSLPVFRLGSVVCARKSVLTDWIADQERNAVSPRAA